MPLLPFYEPGRRPPKTGWRHHFLLQSKTEKAINFHMRDWILEILRALHGWAAPLPPLLQILLLFALFGGFVMVWYLIAVICHLFFSKTFWH